MKWKILKSETVIQNDFFSITKDKCEKTDGSIVGNYYTVNRPDVVVIAAFTPDMNIILIKQYRHPVKAADFELPAGYLEPSDTDISKAAQRELLEETGYKCEKLEKINEAYASAGFMNNTINFFIGFNAEKVGELKLDENEELEAKVTPWEDALKLLEQGRIKDLGSVAGVMLAKEYLKKHA